MKEICKTITRTELNTCTDRYIDFHGKEAAVVSCSNHYAGNPHYLHLIQLRVAIYVNTIRGNK